MNSKHLSDLEIQKFLFQDSNPEPGISRHLEQCAECSIKTDEYRQIFAAVGKEKKPVFEFELTELVMKKLPSGKSKRSIGKLLVYLVLFMVMPVAGVLIYLFYTRFSILLTGISPFSVYLVATGMISLLLFLSIDIFTQYKKKMNTIEIY